MNIYKILIAIDNSQCAEKAAKTGYEMASKFGSEVALINIVEPAPTNVSADFTIAPLFLEDYEQAEDNSHYLLQEMARKYSNGIKSTYLTIIDSPTHGIIEQAEIWGADLIVVGTHGRTGLFHFLMGSVAEHVARKSSCPVLIVPNKS